MYFVMLIHQNGRCLPLIEDINGHECPVLFEAEEAGENNLLGEGYGFEVYEW